MTCSCNAAVCAQVVLRLKGGRFLAPGLLASHIPTGSVCLQTRMYTNDGYTISLKATIGQDILCQAINQPDQSKCACTSDYYLVDIEDASYTMHAAIIVPTNKPVGAGAFQRALLQSLNRGAVALVVPPSLDLGPIYRWLFVLQPVVNLTIRFGVI